MHRKSPMSNSHPPLISEGIYRVQGCREEVISLNSKPHSSDRAGVRLPPTHRTTNHERRYWFVQLFLDFIMSASMAVYNYLKLKHAKLTSQGALAGRFDVWSLTKADGPGIDAPPSPMTWTDFTALEPYFLQCNTRRQEEPGQGHMNYTPSRTSLGMRVLSHN